MLDELRQKPERIRKVIAFTTSGAITLLIFGIWLATWHAVPGVATSNTSNDQQASVAETNPVQAIGQIFANGWAAISSQFASSKNQVTNVLEALPTASTTATVQNQAYFAPSTQTDTSDQNNSSFIMSNNQYSTQ